MENAISDKSHERTKMPMPPKMRWLKVIKTHFKLAND